MGSFAIGIALGLPAKRPVLIGIAALLLGAGSMMATSYHWGGGYPRSELLLQLDDERGIPIEGVVVQVLDRASEEPSYKYPIVEFTTLDSLVSDSEGRVVCHQVADKANGRHSTFA